MYLLYVRGIGSTFFAVTDTKLFTFFMSKIITNCKREKHVICNYDNRPRNITDSEV